MGPRNIRTLADATKFLKSSGALVGDYVTEAVVVEVGHKWTSNSVRLLDMLKAGEWYASSIERQLGLWI